MGRFCAEAVRDRLEASGVSARNRGRTIGEARTASQSAELTAKGMALFKKYGYSNLTPEFQQLFSVKISQFVWSINQQLPEIVNKLIEKYPEAQKGVGAAQQVKR